MNILQVVDRAVQEVYGIVPDIALSLDVPPRPDLGDFAVNCFALAKQFGESPVAIAEKVAKAVRTGDVVASAKANGPYVNLQLSDSFFFGEACRCNVDPLPSVDKRVMVEYLSPNTNKPLHLGHVRNGVLGMAVANVLEWAGFSVIRANLVNDRGVHICKSMLAWQRFSGAETPESRNEKGDHFVGRYYVKFAQAVKDEPTLEGEAQALLLKWELGDEDVIALWKRMNAWVYAGFAETYKRIGFRFDVFYYESELYMSGKDIVQEGLDRGVFEKDDKGAVIYLLPESKFGKDKEDTPKKKVLLRSDGTSVYTTQDLGVALRKVKDYPLDASIYVVACEQDDHFRALFDILQTLGYPWANQLHHLSYGMVELPSGRMKSREGTVVDADDLIDDVVALATADVREKNPDLPEKEIAHRADVIGIGAIKFYLLRSNPKQKIKFDPKESISFDGVTGLYCQYAYARTQSLMDKASQWKSDVVEYALLGSNLEERVLAQNLVLFRGKLKQAAREYNPSLVAGAAYDLARSFNQWYNRCQILDETNPEVSIARLALVQTTGCVLRTSLNLLGIDVLNRM